MLSKVLSILAYLGLLGWVIAYALGKDDSFVNSHLKNASVLIIISLLALIFQIMGLFFLSAIFHLIWTFLALLGIIYVILDREEVPILTQIYENYLSQYLESFF